MRGDLDWIVMKALEKDRARRYVTVNGFAMDIRRYLAGEAIAARPPSRLYKVRKLVLRHKLLFFAFCAVVLLLVICLVITCRLLAEERRMRNEALVAQIQDRGDSLRSAHDWNGAADRYVEALRLQARVFGLNQPRASQLLRAAADTLSQAGRSEEAARLVGEYYIPAQAGWPQPAEWLDWRAAVMARQGRWREAMEDAALAVKYFPSIERHHALAVLLVANRHLLAYQQLCQEMIASYNGTPYASVADKVAKDCLILPSSEVDLAAVAAFAETAVTRGKGETPYNFYLCAKALADYRQGKFQDAVAWTSVILKDPFHYTQAEASAVLAMAQFRIGQTEEARATFAKLERVVGENLPLPRSVDLGNDWKDWVIAHALLDEARSLIEGPSSTKLDWRARSHE